MRFGGTAMFKLASDGCNFVIGLIPVPHGLIGGQGLMDLPSYCTPKVKFTSLILVLLFSLNGCSNNLDPGQATNPDPASTVQPNCSAMSTASLEHYDALTQQFLDGVTSNPDTNADGEIVWGTRYYMESLLDAYEATRNLKYIQAFINAGTSVMSDMQTLSVVDAPDPSIPGSTVNSPLITVTGWPTKLGSFTEFVPIPTSTGRVALYVQNLDTSVPNEPLYFQVTQNGDGSLNLSWTNDSQTLETNTVKTVADLSALASAPLVFDQAYGRITSTGLGLPEPGTYPVFSQLATIWDEQTGGILLPLVRFLVLAKNSPRIANPSLVANWTAKVVAVAGDYTNEFVSDGEGGLRLRDPIWLPNSVAGLNADADYIGAEISMRMLLYELTGNAEDLSIAQGLVTHQKTHHWQTDSNGWLLLKGWPCVYEWSTPTDAPLGSIWSSLQYDSSTPETIEDGALFVEAFHYAHVLGLASSLGLSNDLYSEFKSTVLQYLFADPSDAMNNPAGILRATYPTINSTASDPLSPSQYPWSGAWYVAPEVSDENYVNTNWDWMLKYALSPAGSSVGYFLRAWAESEAAELNVCKSQ